MIKRAWKNHLQFPAIYEAQMERSRCWSPTICGIDESLSVLRMFRIVASAEYYSCTTAEVCLCLPLSTTIHSTSPGKWFLLEQQDNASTSFRRLSNGFLTSIPNLCFNALAVRVGDHHSSKLHSNSRLSVRPKAWHSPVGSWALVLSCIRHVGYEVGKTVGTRR